MLNYKFFLLKSLIIFVCFKQTVLNTDLETAKSGSGERPCSRPSPTRMAGMRSRARQKSPNRQQALQALLFSCEILHFIHQQSRFFLDFFYQQWLKQPCRHRLSTRIAMTRTGIATAWQPTLEREKAIAGYRFWPQVQRRLATSAAEQHRCRLKGLSKTEPAVVTFH